MTHPFTRGTPEPWATAWGEDRYGLFQSFEVEGVEQRLRWIPPGRFLMGSSESEAGQRKNEGPQHEVRLTRGFWLAETPCTQALYQAVMGQNPSRFKDPRRPVERVTWRDVAAFLNALGELVSDLEPRLPTEAEWEYACRARTSGATYSEVPWRIVGETAALALEDMAWFVGNSKGESQPVGLKRPNPWGLYDMLGNVREWCHDGMREYAAASISDPLGPTYETAARVVRGGSWDVFARSVHAAYRHAYLPERSGVHLGFRIAHGRIPTEPAVSER
jgi:formylglycine-generating enzyme required for sulfatase activity